jgi:hypothetical protein
MLAGDNQSISSVGDLVLKNIHVAVLVVVKVRPD